MRNQRNQKSTTEPEIGPTEPDVETLRGELVEFLHRLGPDIERVPRQHYDAFRRRDGRNVACLDHRARAGELRLAVALDPDDVEKLPTFARDLRDVGHFGTGDLELRLASREDLFEALPLLYWAYEEQSERLARAS